MTETILHWVTHYGAVGLFSMLVLGIVGVPFPDEVLLIFAGSLIDKGTLHALATVIAAMAGSMCGITVSYGLGRTLGLKLVHQYGHYVHLSADTIEPIRPWLIRWGKWGLVLGYFIPGVRHLSAYLAGTTKFPMAVFVPFAYAGACIWSLTFITVGYLAGESWQQVASLIHRHLLLAAATVVALGCVALLVYVRYRK